MTTRKCARRGCSANSLPYSRYESLLGNPTCSAYCRDLADAQEAIDELRARVDVLKAALERYASHEIGCRRRYMFGGGACTCARSTFRPRDRCSRTTCRWRR